MNVFVPLNPQRPPAPATAASPLGGTFRKPSVRIRPRPPTSHAQPRASQQSQSHRRLSSRNPDSPLPPLPDTSAAPVASAPALSPFSSLFTRSRIAGEMAASPSISGPLDALQSIINDVLVQTGKALRASRRDSQGNLTYAYGPTQAKLPDTIEQFHMTLHDLETEILSAKSVLLRDYNELQEKKRQILLRPSFQTGDGQTKRPPTVEMATPPEPVFKDETMAEDTGVKPMAPFPNMSIDLAEPEPMEISVKDLNGQQPQQQQPPPPGGMNGLNATASPAIASQPPNVDPKPTADMHTGPSGPAMPPAMPETSGMNFTDMEFTLAAPPGSEAAGQPNTTKEPSFDMATFAPPEGGDDLLNLNHLLPADANNASGAAPRPQTKADGGAAPVNTDFFGPGSGAADGMDFDFSLGGSGDDTFDDLMNNRDSTFELMDAGGDFDTAFFGLDKADENPA
ncbi:hypothetical protein M440DRAFT_1439910 [Trichoderma longibrachiatum ATCC 18648]|uniref:Uncharacterized protein n=1 Tax=Trichoderma longibrachiatum ATCC 18648 TaxID=983965 RepID=A0A2T4C1D2_TRILO|nr:hypothetical protein M440DRAFT_1439910 [Trichoderma longibrachiatum ATCC 18648]